MTHRIYQFGSIPLPPAMPEDDLSTGQTESTLLNSAGGGFDAWGAARRLPRRQQITLRGMYEISDGGRFDAGRVEYLVDHGGNNLVDHSGNRIMTDFATLALRRNVDSLKAVLGARARLYRRREDDNAVEWKLARLLKVAHPREIDDAAVVAQVEVVFETLHAAWRRNAATTVAATLPAGLPLQNNSDIPVADAVLTIDATGTISQLWITGPGMDLTWAGSLTSGQTLTLDAGAQTLRRGSADQYAGLTRGPAHTAAGWLMLPPGASVLMVTANGPGTASLTYHEQHL